MEAETLIFMPNGDVTLRCIRHVQQEQEFDSPILTRANSISSNISGHSRSSTAVGQSGTTDEQAKLDEFHELEKAELAGQDDAELESLLFYAPEPPNGADGPLYPPEPRVRRGSDASSRRDRSSSPPASFWAALKRQQQRLAPAVEEALAVNLPETKPRPKKIVTFTQEVNCIVSSHHLSLASENFQTLLSGDSPEAQTLQSTGHVNISLSSDPDTLIILLNIIHGASRKVPRQISLELLRKLAVMVSDFGMLGTVEFFSDTWIDNSKRQGLPTTYTEDVLNWLFVFLVFEREEEFKDMTRITQWECDEKFDENAREIELPKGIIDAIKRDRKIGIETAINVIHELINKYMDGQLICEAGMDDDLKYACDAMLLGSLMKGSRKVGIWPKLEAPYNGKKFKDLTEEIKGIKIMDVCGKSSRRKWSSYGGLENNGHGLEDFIREKMKIVEGGLAGLDLEEYRGEKSDSWDNFRNHILPSVKVKSTEEAIEDLEGVNPEKEGETEASTEEVEVFLISPTHAAHYPPSSTVDEEIEEISISAGETTPTAEKVPEQVVNEDTKRYFLLKGNMARLLEEDAPQPQKQRDALEWGFSSAQVITPAVEHELRRSEIGFFAAEKTLLVGQDEARKSPNEELKEILTPKIKPTTILTFDTKVKSSDHSYFEIKDPEPKSASKSPLYQPPHKASSPSPPSSAFNFSLTDHTNSPSLSPYQSSAEETKHPKIKSESQKILTPVSAKLDSHQNQQTKYESRKSSPPLQALKEELANPTTNKPTTQKLKLDVRELTRQSLKESTTPSLSSIHFTNDESGLVSKNDKEKVVMVKDENSGKENGKERSIAQELAATTTEEESDLWVPPTTYRGKKNKKRFSVNRF